LHSPAQIADNRPVVFTEVENRAPASRYTFKPSPYSSHSMLLASLPESGEGRSVLDVGCASGYLAGILAERGFRVTGIDAPGRAAAFPTTCSLIETDLDSGLPRLPGFDYVVCGDILEHLREPARMLGNIARVLAPGGRLIASLPNSGHAYFRWNVSLGRFPQHDRGLFDRTHLHFYTWQGWRDLFAGGGFEIESVRSSGVPVGLALPRLSETLLVRILERLSYESARLWKTLFAYQFIVVARHAG
jgi:SAM-dependent methyltransferase